MRNHAVLCTKETKRKEKRAHLQKGSAEPRGERAYVEEEEIMQLAQHSKARTAQAWGSTQLTIKEKILEMLPRGCRDG